MHDDVGAVDDGRQCGRIGEIGFDGTYIRRRDDIGGERCAVIHQPKLVPARQQMAREQAAEIAGSPGNQDNHTLRSGALSI